MKVQRFDNILYGENIVDVIIIDTELKISNYNIREVNLFKNICSFNIYGKFYEIELPKSNKKEDWDNSRISYNEYTIANYLKNRKKITIRSQKYFRNKIFLIKVINKRLLKLTRILGE